MPKVFTNWAKGEPVMSSIGVRQGFTYQFFLNETHKKLLSSIIELYFTEASASFHYFTITYSTNYHESEYFSLNKRPVIFCANQRIKYFTFSYNFDQTLQVLTGCKYMPSFNFF